MRPLTGTQKTWLITALALATLIKLYLAWTTEGSTDVAAFADQLAKIRELGVGAYGVRGPFNNQLNHPPPMFHVLKSLGFLADLSHLPFRFWLRLLPSLADVGMVALTSRLIENVKHRFLLLMMLALCPISIIISGYHGNTDPAMITCLLLSIYLLQVRKSTLAAGVAFGMACSVKVDPLLFAPAIILYLPDVRSRAKFAIAAAVFFVLASLPYIVQQPILIAKFVFGYGSIYGSWGFSQFLAIFSNVQYAHPPYEPLGIHAVVASVLKYVTLLSICALSVWMNYKKRVPLFLQCGTITSLFLFLTPGFGPHYLVWFAPFVVLLGVRHTLALYLLAGSYLAYKYLGLPESDVPHILLIGLFLSLGCWTMIYFCFRKYFDELRQIRSQTTLS